MSSCNCIVAPHVLHAIARNGTPSQREDALRTLSVDTTIRSVRALAVPTQPRPSLGPALVNRSIYDAHQRMVEPGTLVRAEGIAAGPDIEVNEAYDGLGHTWDMYHSVYGRNSIDDHGLPLIGTVHYGTRYDNAFWDGAQMVFGDGDGQIFNRFTIAVDVIGHELTHGVTAVEAGLVYHDQPGALNESISDVFGSLVKQFTLDQTVDEADWLIGAGLLAYPYEDQALRSMKAPGTAYDNPLLGKDPQPAIMKNYIHTMEDNGGVHLNSGIPNHAFYLAAIAIGGHAYDRTGQIWYDALRDPRLRRSASFSSFASRTIAAASTRYGHASNERIAVAAAWHTVGVRTT